jgi:WhiB family redox-sensing transcriptional regulator
VAPTGLVVVAAHSWEYGWQWRAACRGEDSSLFFAPNHPETKDEKHIREREAKSICAICPVRIECLEYAVRIRETHGIWGGLNELERRLLIRERERRAGTQLHAVPDPDS